MANILTVLRLVLTGVFLYVMFASWSGRNAVAAVVFGLAVLTDWLDGLIARTAGRITEVGKLLDPLADRLLLITAVVALYLRDGLPALWALILLLTRDILIMGGYLYLKRQGEKMAVTNLGKIATAALMLSFILLIAGFQQVIWIFYLGLALYLISGVNYVWEGRRLIERNNKWQI